MSTPPSTAPVLLVLADAEVADAVQAAAARCGLDTEHATTVGDLLQRLSTEARRATLVSLGVEHVDEELLGRIAASDRTGALILTAPGVSLRGALLMERAGAIALLREPIEETDLAERLAGLLDEGREVRIPPSGSESVSDPTAPPPLVGESAPMGHVFETIARVARSAATVLLTGESGSGKEVIARTIHWASDRSSGPFVAINCAAIPEHLLESELFGHERGAFTGAVARRVGRFERANGGTLFLDEIGDMSMVLQAKVLRALEERVVERVGGEEPRSVDVRLIAATNQDLVSARHEGRFREDLYYRLAVVELALPPLRERAGDIRRLALHFAAHFAERHARPITWITEAALGQLERAEWAGNVRELRNVMDRAVLLATGTTIRTGDLRILGSSPGASAPSGSAEIDGYSPTFSLQEVEAGHIRRVLADVGGHMGQAAERLGIHRNTLTRKMKEYAIEGGAGGEAR